MTRRRRLALLLPLLLPLLLLPEGAGCSMEQTFVEPELTWSRMQEQPRYDPYEPSAFFSDGRTMRTPPEGTVPRERAFVARPEVASGLDARGQELGAIPLPVTRALLAAGRDRFNVVCASCHGVLGDGVSPVAQNMQLRRPPSLHQPNIRAYAPGRIYRYVTFGFGMMPAHGPYLTLEERWAIVAYVRALQLSQFAPVAQLPADVRAELAREAP